jgi:glycosyltransferase involved in cell wall biosynthesis
VSNAIPRTLFVGRGNGAVAWYRCALPAMVLGADWIGVAGDPPNLKFLTGVTTGTATFERFFDYDVVVVQLAQGKAWLKAIRELQAAGVTVLYEVDDWFRAVRKLNGHAFKDHFDREAIEAFELCMRVCDGVICSTPWLAEHYRPLNARTWVCRNGIDLRRYALTRPQRSTVAIGWAGATGHVEAMRPWLGEVAAVMRDLPATRFISIGEPFARELEPEFGAQRCMPVPFAPFDVYPAAMTLFDVALAPAGRNNFFRGKSDLRWLEASALRIPVIADPDVYPSIEHGVTGFHASSPEAMRELLRELVADADLRARVGGAAYDYVTEHRTAQATAQDWAGVLAEVAPGAVAA